MQSWHCINEFLQFFKGNTAKIILGKDKQGVTPLHLAAKLECPKILKVLILMLIFINEQ